jgi:hypothetical protein
MGFVVPKVSLGAELSPSVFIPPVFQIHPSSQDDTVGLSKVTELRDLAYPLIK